MGSTHKASAQDGLRSILSKWTYYSCHNPQCTLAVFDPRSCHARLRKGTTVMGLYHHWLCMYFTESFVYWLQVCMYLIGLAIITDVFLPCNPCHQSLALQALLLASFSLTPSGSPPDVRGVLPVGDSPGPAHTPF